MSLKSIIANSNCKDFKDRSKKLCCCGHHNNRNVKKNLHHNSTKRKNNYKIQRKFETYLHSIFLDDYMNEVYRETIL